MAAAAVTVAGATTAVAAPADAGGAAPGSCTSAELSPRLTDGDAGAGSVFQKLVLTNVGNRTCTLQGFPSVSYVDQNDAQVGSPSVPDGPPGGVVTLAPDQSAGAEVRFVNAQNFDPAQCQPTPVVGLRVFPTSDTFGLRIPRPGLGCANPAVSLLSVRTFTPFV